MKGMQVLFGQRSVVQSVAPSGVRRNSTPRYHFIIARRLKITKALAELIGILLGDGSIGIYESKGYSTHYVVKISFDKILKQEYLSYVNDLLLKVLNERGIVKHRKESNCSDLFIFKKDVVNLLLSIGLVQAPKWERAIIPKPFLSKALGRHVLRGYFDSDGSVVLTDNNGVLYPRLEMKISPSPMQEQFLLLLDQYKFKYGC